MMARLGSRHTSDSVVDFGHQGERTLRDLQQDVATVARELPEPGVGRDVLLCFRTDRYAFTVALLATWQSGLVAVLPPNLAVETLSKLIDSPTRVALLHDTKVSGHLHVPDLLKNRPATPLSRLPHPDGVVARVLTSGSTGESQSWGKTCEQLLGEIATWSELFEGSPPRVVSTAQPGHLYGLLFSVLYPLATGGAFCAETPNHAEAISRAVAAGQANTLVTVPVHLRSLQLLDPGQLSSVERTLSSTAPLHENDARAHLERHGCAVTEIFGSTETGGVAWRRRSERAAWSPLPSVSVGVSEAERLVVDSPFASDGLPRPFETADRVAFDAGGRFESLGRVDSVVKIGGKRVHLLEQEAWLLKQPEVRDATLLDVPDAARGVRLLALVAGDDGAGATLRSRMAAAFEPSVIPKRFVFLHKLPRGPNGKLSRKSALALFGLTPSGEAASSELDVAEEEKPGSFSVRVPHDFVWFQGHFDGYPVMAGAVQLLALIRPILRRMHPGLGELRLAEGLKFTGRICPGDEVRVAVTSSALGDASSTGPFNVRVVRDGKVLTAGKLSFFEAAPESMAPAGEA